MKTTSAAPGALVGMAGLIIGLASLVAESPLLGAAAGICAGAAGWWLVILNRRILEHESRQQLIDTELGEVKAQAAETEKAITELKEPEPSSAPTTADTLIDDRTGLFSESFFRVALESRIASARRHLRPISVIMLTVDNSESESETSEDVALAIKETIRDADTACQLGSGEFALVLEDTPETGAVWTVERIRRNLNDGDAKTTVWAGVACYPAHAFTRDDIINASLQALTSAKDWNQDRIEVATAVE